MRGYTIAQVALLLGIFSCTNGPSKVMIEKGSLLWVDNSLSDISIKKAVHETVSNSSIIIAQISWSPEDSSFFENTRWYSELAKNHYKSFMLNIDWLANTRDGVRGNWAFSQQDVRTKFENDVKSLISSYRPDYVTLGIEVNYYALTNPEDFKAFVKIFNSLKPQLEEINPRIKIGLSYQLELLYGNHKEWLPSRTLATLDAIVPNLDYVGLSTYPDFYRGSNENFQSLNYLDSLTLNYTVPVGISETGIISTYLNTEERKLYLKTLSQKTSQVPLNFLIWGSMIDRPEPKATWDRQIGLLDTLANRKEEFDVWLMLCENQ